MRLIGIIFIVIIILLYILWLRFIKNKEGVSAREDESGAQVFNIAVKGVYSPNVIKAKVGRPVKINFKREEEKECSRFVNFPDFHIRKELPEDQTVAIEFIPEKKGEYLFACDMSMYQGRLIVE